MRRPSQGSERDVREREILVTRVVTTDHGDRARVSMKIWAVERKREVTDREGERQYVDQ